jgi:hypothetical protein
MVVLLARRLPCSLPPPRQRRDQHAGGQQVVESTQRGGLLAAVVWLGIGPRLRDHPLAAIGEHHQQFHHTVAAQPAQDPYLLPVQRIPAPGDRHHGHR